MSDLTYDQWKIQVDRHIFEQVGLHADDLPDWPYRNAYDSGAKPAIAARKAVKTAKKDMGL